MADANSVSSGLAVLGGAGWFPTNDPRYGGAFVLWRSSWANRPVAGQIADGQPLLVTDIGPTPGTPFMWDAANARWRPQTGVALLAQSAVPIIIPSSGASNGTGQITATTALPYVPGGTVLVYLPAGVIVGDAVGGLKQAVFSSTTVCQLVGNPATANGAYVQSTAAITLASVTVPGGSMGPNGGVRTTSVWGYPNNANLKTIATTFGGAAQVGNTASASVSTRQQSQYQNRGSQASQVAGSIGNAFGSTGAVNAVSAVDTSIDKPLAVIGQLANAADFLILEAYSVELLA